MEKDKKCCPCCGCEVKEDQEKCECGCDLSGCSCCEKPEEK